MKVPAGMESTEIKRMSLAIEPTELHCAFCTRAGLHSPLVRSIHGLYCTNEQCYTRGSGGNLVPPAECAECKENAFYMEESEPPYNPYYVCIACNHRELAQ